MPGIPTRLRTALGRRPGRRLGLRVTTAVAALASAAALAVVPGAAPASAATCTEPVGTPGSIPALGFSKRDWPLTGGLHMETYNGAVNRNYGGVDATTHLYNSYWGMGYTGSVLVLLRNGCGDLIGVTEPRKWGVEAKAWFWNANERFEHWQSPMAVDITSRTASVQVVHNRSVSSTDHIATYNYYRDIACKFWDAYQPGVACKLPRL